MPEIKRGKRNFLLSSLQQEQGAENDCWTPLNQEHQTFLGLFDAVGIAAPPWSWMNSVFPELCLCRHRPGVVIGSVARDAPCSAFQAALGTEEAVGCEMGSACPGTAAPSDPCQGWQRRTQTSSMCLKTQAPLCSLVEVSVFGGSQWTEAVLGAVLEPGEAGQGYPGSAGQGHLHCPSLLQPQMPQRREMLVLREPPLTLTLFPFHLCLSPVWFVPFGGACPRFTIHRCHKVSHGRCPRDRGWEGTTCTTAQLQQGGEDARVASDRCFGKQFRCWGLNRPSIICSTF